MPSIECLPQLPHRADKEHERQPADHLGRQWRWEVFVTIHIGLETAVIFRQDTIARLAS